jgi:hypothetical protein
MKCFHFHVVTLLVLLLLVCNLQTTTGFVPVQQCLPVTSNTRLGAVKTDEEVLKLIRQEVEQNDAMTAWNDCVSLLVQQLLPLQRHQAELLLGTALGWKGWVRVSPTSSARKYMTPPRIPDVTQLKNVLQWLQQGPLALQGQALTQAIQTSPNAYLLDPRTAYQVALQTAPACYKDDPSQFHALLLQDYSVLECSFNCAEEGCSSECGNCWISYERKSNKAKNELTK